MKFKDELKVELNEGFNKDFTQATMGIEKLIKTLSKSDYESIMVAVDGLEKVLAKLKS